MLVPALVVSIISLVVGHPFPVTCGPVVNGWSGATAFDGPSPVAITLESDVCAGFSDRVQTKALAWSLLVTVHESEHVALRSGDEARVEACALAALPSVAYATLPVAHDDSLGRWLAGETVDGLDAAAVAQVGTLPAVYQGGSC